VAPSPTLNKPTTPEGLNAALSRISNYVKPRKKRLLIAEDNEAERFGVTELLSHPDIEIESADTGRAALDKLRTGGSTAWCSTCACPI